MEKNKMAKLLPVVTSGLPLLLGLWSSAVSTPVCAASPAKAGARAAKAADPQRDQELLTTAATGDTKGVERALAHGANLEARDSQYGFTPLMWASWRANLGTMRRLVAKGADVNARTVSLHPASVTLREAGEGDAGAMSFTVSNSGVTPLLLAASSGSGMAVGELLKRGANPKTTTAHGESPLLAAAFAGSVTGVKALLAHGADANQISSSAFRFYSPLLLATVQGQEAVVKELLAGGADATGATPYGKSYAEAARSAGYPRIAELLAQARKAQLAKRAAQAAKTGVAAPTKSGDASNEVRIIGADGSLEVAH